MYKNPDVRALLYDGSNLIVLEAVAHHLLWFTEHSGTSKDTLFGILNMRHHSVLPQHNQLRDSYSSILSPIVPFLVSPLDVCHHNILIQAC